MELFSFTLKFISIESYVGDEINMFIENEVGVINMYIFDDVEKRGRNLLREKEKLNWKVSAVIKCGPEKGRLFV